MTSQSKILDSLKDYRESESITLAELSRRLGFTRAYTSDILSQKKIAGPKFNRAASELLTGGKSKIIPDKQTNRLSTQEFGHSFTIHPKIQAHAEEIMNREGFTDMAQLVTWLIKEDVRQRPLRTPEAQEQAMREAFESRGIPYPEQLFKDEFPKKSNPTPGSLDESMTDLDRSMKDMEEDLNEAIEEENYPTEKRASRETAELPDEEYDVVYRGDKKPKKD